MSWNNITNKSSGDTIPSADFNQIMENIRILGGNGTSEPSSDIETIDGEVSTNTTNISTNTTNISTNATDILRLETGGTGVYRNAIINGDMMISQRGTNFTPDDLDYTIDRIQALCESNGNIDIDQTDEGSSEFSCKITVNTANEQFGICQPIEKLNSQKFQDQVASLIFEAKTTTGKIINNLRCALLSFTGTADTPGNPVSSWAGGGTDPTWSANYTAENTPSNLALATDYQTFTIENISVDTASINNISLVIWCDDTDAAIGDEVFIKNIQINLGNEALPFEHLDYGTNLTRCQRHYEKTFDYGTAPVQNIGTTAGSLIGTAQGNSIGDLTVNYIFKTKKRTGSYTVTFYNPFVASSGFSKNGAGDYPAGIYAKSDNNLGIRNSDTSTTAGGTYLINVTIDDEL